MDNVPAFAARTARRIQAFASSGTLAEHHRIFTTKEPAKWVAAGLATDVGPGAIGGRKMRLTDSAVQLFTR